MADDRHIQCCGRFRRVLRGVDDARGCEEQHHYDQDGNHRPRQLNLVASVNLRRLPKGLRIIGQMAITHQSKGQQTRHEQENDQRNAKD
jgi:hypothetical protein